MDDSDASVESLSAEDWSYNGLLNAVLTDQSFEQDSLTDSIMSRLNLDEGVSKDSVTDTALLKALESELNQSLESSPVVESNVSSSSSMILNTRFRVPWSHKDQRGQRLQFTHRVY